MAIKFSMDGFVKKMIHALHAFVRERRARGVLPGQTDPLRWVKARVMQHAHCCMGHGVLFYKVEQSGECALNDRVVLHSSNSSWQQVLGGIGAAAKLRLFAVCLPQPLKYVP
jgi:hypothetical protein